MNNGIDLIIRELNWRARHQSRNQQPNDKNVFRPLAHGIDRLLSIKVQNCCGKKKELTNV